VLGWLGLLPVCWSALWATFQEPENLNLIALETLLDAEQSEDRAWRVSVWEHLTQLEQAGSPLVLRGWQALARSGSDPDRANLFLYQRRHELARIEVEPAAGPELTLEHCLAAWGDGDLSETGTRLKQALERFPEDTRLQENLLWLEMRSPEPVQLDGSARHLALAVLAARRSRG
jgi:hypothetical protein